MTMPPDDVRDRVLSYARYHAAKGPDGIRQTVERGQRQVLDLLDGMTEEQARYRPGPNDWSVVEVLQHLVAVGEWMAEACADLAGGNPPPRQGSIGDPGSPLASLEEALTALEQTHAAFLRFAGSVSPETNTEATSPHPWFGPLNCLEWAVFQRIHDADHAGQIEQIMASPSFPAA